MKKNIDRLLEIHSKHKEQVSKIEDLKKQLNGFKDSLQYVLKKRDSLSPKVGEPVSLEEYNAMERELKELRKAISGLHFWEQKEKRKLTKKLKELETCYTPKFHAYFTFTEWDSVEKDIEYFSKCVDNDERAMAILMSDMEEINSARKTALTDILHQIASADSETLKSAFGEQKCTELPISVLAEVIKKCQCNLWPKASVSTQIKLLYSYNIPISFGGYKWNALEIRKKKALLLCSDTCLTHELHRDGVKNPTWENSYAREYLNGSFLNKLNAEKSSKICTNQDGDRIFLLNKREVEKYLAPCQMAVPAGNWWLRDVSDWGNGLGHYAAYVDTARKISHQYPNYPSDGSGDKIGYRPALWVALDSVDGDDRENQKFPINCKGKWATKGKYDDVSLSLDHIMRIMSGNKNTSSSSDIDGWGEDIDMQKITKRINTPGYDPESFPDSKDVW